MDKRGISVNPSPVGVAPTPDHQMDPEWGRFAEPVLSPFLGHLDHFWDPLKIRAFRKRWNVDQGSGGPQTHPPRTV